MTNLSINDVRVFVPAKDFAISKDFYLALGWTLKWCVLIHFAQWTQ